jgi:hypothetical protein
MDKLIKTGSVRIDGFMHYLYTDKDSKLLYLVAELGGSITMVDLSDKSKVPELVPAIVTHTVALLEERLLVREGIQN